MRIPVTLPPRKPGETGRRYATFTIKAGKIEKKIKVYEREGSLYIVDNKQIPYEYEKERNYAEIGSLFLRETYLSLDRMYKNNALEIEIYGEKINVLDKLINGKVKVYICPVVPNRGIGSETEFDSLTDKIYFDYEKGIEFFKYRMGENAPDINDRIGYNSPDSLLAHELIHAYNSNYDTENYIKRKKEIYPSSSSSYENSTKYQGFPNEEERYVTIELANQVNEILGETKRMNYSQKSVQKK